MARNGPILVPPKYPTHFLVRRKFQPLIGKRRTEEILEVLTQAYAACTGLKANAAAIRGKGANIYTQWVGDPDALAVPCSCAPS